MNRYSCYEYNTRIIKSKSDWPTNKEYVWTYEIYGDDYLHGYGVIRESDEWYDAEDEADTAAKAHIDLLESGEG